MQRQRKEKNVVFVAQYKDIEQFNFSLVSQVIYITENKLIMSAVDMETKWN